MNKRKRRIKWGNVALLTIITSMCMYLLYIFINLTILLYNEYGLKTTAIIAIGFILLIVFFIITSIPRKE